MSAPAGLPLGTWRLVVGPELAVIESPKLGGPGRWYYSIQAWSDDRQADLTLQLVSEDVELVGLGDTIEVEAWAEPYRDTLRAPDGVAYYRVADVVALAAGDELAYTAQLVARIADDWALGLTGQAYDSRGVFHGRAAAPDVVALGAVVVVVWPAQLARREEWEREVAEAEASQEADERRLAAAEAEAEAEAAAEAERRRLARLAQLGEGAGAKGD